MTICALACSLRLICSLGEHLYETKTTAAPGYQACTESLALAGGGAASCRRWRSGLGGAQAQRASNQQSTHTPHETFGRQGGCRIVASLTIHNKFCPGLLALARAVAQAGAVIMMDATVPA